MGGAHAQRERERERKRDGEATRRETRRRTTALHFCIFDKIRFIFYQLERERN